MKRHILIDGNNLLHKAFHAFVSGNDNKYMSDSGYPTGMIHGPLSMLSGWSSSFGRFDSVHFFNDGSSARRRAMDPQYKKNRDFDRPSFNNMPKTATTLIDGFKASSEVEVLMHVLQMLGVSMYSIPGEEADDLVASFIKAHPDDVHIILSSDKDFFQLLTNPRVVICYPGGYGSGVKILDAEGAEEHWGRLNKGKHPKIPPANVRMFKSLCGDSSDNIPGVFLLRKKVAADVSSYPSIEAIEEAGWPGFSGSERQKASSMMDRIRLTWKMVGLVEDLPVVPLPGPAMDASKASMILRSMNIWTDTDFIVPKHVRNFVSDVPVRVNVLGSDWLDSI